MVISRYELPPNQEIMETIVAEMGYVVELIHDTDPIPDAVIYGDTTYVKSSKPTKMFMFNGDHWVYQHVYGILYLSSIKELTTDELGNMILKFVEKLPLKDPSQEPMERFTKDCTFAEDASELTLMSP